MENQCDYDCQAELWMRDKPVNSSDFFGRPQLIGEIIKIGRGKDLIDAGCGEGYIARIVRPYARSVLGFDASSGMIACARKQDEKNPLGISYMVGDIRAVPSIDSSSCEVYYSSMVFHYLNPDELVIGYRELRRMLRPQGDFLVLVSHPKNLESMARSPKRSAWLTENKIFDPVLSRGEYFDMGVRGIDGKILHVGMYYSTLEDHANAIKRAGLDLSSIDELTISHEVGKSCPLLEDRVGDTVWAIIKGKRSS